MQESIWDPFAAHRSHGFLLIQPSPCGISLPAGTVFFRLILKAVVGLAEPGGVKGCFLLPNQAGIAEPIWKTCVIHRSCFFVQ